MNDRILVQDTLEVDKFRDENIPGFGPDFKDDNTKGDYLNSVKEAPQGWTELKVETPTVDRMLAKFVAQWTKTADECIERAGRLEEEAADLRGRADKLRGACILSDEVKGAVMFEIESRIRAE